MSETTEGTQVQEQAPVQETANKKANKTGNLIFDIATEVEGLTKTKALNMADRLAEDIETNYFKLGGVLKVIRTQQWFEGYPTFDAFVLERFGFRGRKSYYLMDIYTHLVDKQVPWEKVAHVGWTKLKDIAEYLTPENVDEWAAKAASMTVSQLDAHLKALKGSEGSGATPGTAKTTSNTVKQAFTLHQDQYEVVQSALAKAKGELQTEHDNVALAAICSGYLANASGIAQPGAPVDLAAEFGKVGFENVLAVFEQCFPHIDLDVSVNTPGEAAPAEAQAT